MNQPKATSSQILSARSAVNFVGRCAGRLGLVARFAFGRVPGMDGFYASKLGELELFVQPAAPTVITRFRADLGFLKKTTA